VIAVAESSADGQQLTRVENSISLEIEKRQRIINGLKAEINQLEELV